MTLYLHLLHSNTQSEVVPDGFGVAYMIKERSLHFNIVCTGLGADRLHYYLGEAARDMCDIFDAELAAKAK